MAKSRMKTLIEPYVVRNGRHFRLKDVDPGDTAGFKSDKSLADAILQDGVATLQGLQEKLYAQDRWGVLLVFQAMDAAGKDGAIKHVMSGINPQGCQVFSFKQPSSQDLDHDFLWRNLVCLPERGRIGIFNRSYYEEVLVVRVHPELLQRQQIPGELVTKRIWQERYEDINAVERYLARNGYVIRKFFLHLSKKEQAKRFEKRLDEPDKQWKFSLGDLHEPGRMEGLRRGVRGHDSSHRHVPRALGRRPGQQEMVRPVGRGRNRHRRARGVESGVPESDRRQAERAPKGPPHPADGTPRPMTT